MKNQLYYFLFLWLYCCHAVDAQSPTSDISKDKIMLQVKEDNPLDGVTTFDLVLISRHILGLTPLNSPYKIIAADANKSGTITSFDIVELRKLILGIYTKLPANTSWRFVDKDFVFPNPQNPFDTAFPETKTIAEPDLPLSDLDFIAIKVGDVNNTAIASDRPAERPVALFALPVTAPRNDKFVTVPVVYTGTQTLLAVQLGMRFNPSHLRLVTPATGDLDGYNLNFFGLQKQAEGEIRTLWVSDIADNWQSIQPGTVLFYLTFEVLSPQAFRTDNTLQLDFDDAVLPNAAWDMTDQEYAVAAADADARNVLPAKPVNAAFKAVCLPNPAHSDARLTLSADNSGGGYIALFDAFGKRLALNPVQWQKGEQTFALPAFASQPSGIYRWAIFGNGQSAQGLVMKL